MLKLHNIIKSFTTSYRPVLKDLSLELSKGEFCIVLGSNGCGKSTMLKIIAGEVEEDQGKVMINDNYIPSYLRSKFISAVVQDVNKGTIPDFTLLENMVLTMPKEQQKNFAFYNHYKEKAILLLKEAEIGLENYLNTKLANLSGGQRQMIATLIAINSNPKILLLDEHTSALDPKHQKILMDYTAAKIAKHSITTLMVTHKLDDAINYGNRIVMLHQGNIVFDTKKEEKSKLTARDLLNLFHQYEDFNLIGGEK